MSALLGDSRGALWVGSSDNGLICRQNDRVIKFGTGDGLPANSITALAEDATGQIWIGTRAGLAMWQSKRPIKLLSCGSTIPGPDHHGAL